MAAMKDHVDCDYIAERLGVTRWSVARWARAGKFFAEKRGREWLIPRTDAMLFINNYGKRVGTPLHVESVARVAEYAPQHETRAVSDQHLNLSVPAWLLRTIDDLRREEEKPRTRTKFLVAALTEWTQQERRRRIQARKKAAS